MKRMYVTLAVILLVCVWAATALSQMTIQTLPQTQSDPQAREPFNREKRRAELREQKRAEMRAQREGQMSERMKMREEMHRRIRDMLINGNGNPDDLFADMEEEFEKSMRESFADVDAMSGMTVQSSNFKSEWKETKTGRVLEVTPQDKDQKLNIDVNAEAITIKGESKQQTATTSFTSAFTNSFPVPGDCDGTRVKLNSVDGKILVELPFKSTAKVSAPAPKVITPPKEERRPLPPSEGDVEI